MSAIETAKMICDPGTQLDPASAIGYAEELAVALLDKHSQSLRDKAQLQGHLIQLLELITNCQEAALQKITASTQSAFDGPIPKDLLERYKKNDNNGDADAN